MWVFLQEEDFTNLKLALPVAEYHVFIASKHMIYAQSGKLVNI